MFLEQNVNNQAAGASTAFMVIYVVALVAFFYFMFLRPQRKEQKKIDEIRNGVLPGDNIMTTGGFYGVVLDVVDDTVIVEFGNNKNCRIPMHKNAIAEVERDEDKEEQKDEKAGNGGERRKKAK
ncbi:MAG: preprotein translocase subunit YajC [Lachnospiraceae bacterium]|nr:preprotein translocase subunit YajC [Lachnospiraceae bacterium]